MNIRETHTIKTPRQERFGQLLAMDESKVLVREFGGKLKVYDRALATAMPLRPKLSAGSAADATLFGSMRPVTVVRVDGKIGRVFTTYQLGRTEKEKVFALVTFGSRTIHQRTPSSLEPHPGSKPALANPASVACCN